MPSAATDGRIWIPWLGQPDSAVASSMGYLSKYEHGTACCRQNSWRATVL